MRYTLAQYNVFVTNINAGPITTSFTNRFGNAQTGGKGTRQFSDPTGFLTSYSNRMVEVLNERMNSAEAQTPDQVGVFIVELIRRRWTAKDVTEVPFNVGNTTESQKVIERTRVNPTGEHFYDHIILKDILSHFTWDRLRACSLCLPLASMYLLLCLVVLLYVFTFTLTLTLTVLVIPSPSFVRMGWHIFRYPRHGPERSWCQQCRRAVLRVPDCLKTVPAVPTRRPHAKSLCSPILS
jgi:hypothetical protein